MGTKEITFTGTASGDMECFCWDKVSQEDVIKMIGQEAFDNLEGLELECLEDDNDMFERTEEEIKKTLKSTLSRVYPGDVIEACLGKETEQDKVYKFTIKAWFLLHLFLWFP